jgi:large repetitive protein
VNGVATLTSSTLLAGKHNITAVYSGDGNVGGSTSATVSQVVRKEASRTTLTSSQNPVPDNFAVTFTATISTRLATGKVIFFDGLRVLGEANVANGVAALTTSRLDRGFHVITAVYAGDNNVFGSISNLVQEEVTRKQR